MYLIRTALAALVAATLFATPAAAAQDPTQPVPANDPACQVANPPRVCLVDDRRQYQGREPAPTTTSDAEMAARFTDSIAPRRLADFAGTWHHHGFWLMMLPSGAAEIGWRTYDDTPTEPAGRATVVFTRAQDRTAYGMVTSTTDARVWPLGPVRLTEHAHGVGVLDADGWDDAQASYRPFTVCGPRYDTAPDWLVRLAPCGA